MTAWDDNREQGANEEEACLFSPTRHLPGFSIPEHHPHVISTSSKLPSSRCCSSASASSSTVCSTSLALEPPADLLFKVAILLVNAVAILSEDRFLARSMSSCPTHSPFFSPRKSYFDFQTAHFRFQSSHFFLSLMSPCLLH